MGRPVKKRRICQMPECQRFRPEEFQECLPIIQMTVDEYECIRLVDYEELTQAECAAQMQVARTTVQMIYESARKKLAQCLVESRSLCISGGHYELCGGAPDSSGCGCRCPNAGCADEELWGNERMKKIAVTYENGEIFQHFGHTEQFKLYDIEDGKVAKEEVIGTDGNGHGALATFLSGQGVDTLICGGIGAGAQNALADAGIRLYGGVQGRADDAVQALLEDRLEYNPSVHCDHHGHGEGHGHMHGHGCGHHSCG